MERSRRHTGSREGITVGSSQGSRSPWMRCIAPSVSTRSGAGVMHVAGTCIAIVPSCSCVPKGSKDGANRRLSAAAPRVGKPPNDNGAPTEQREHAPTSTLTDATCMRLYESLTHPRETLSLELRYAVGLRRVTQIICTRIYCRWLDCPAKKEAGVTIPSERASRSRGK